MSLPRRASSLAPYPSSLNQVRALRTRSLASQDGQRFHTMISIPTILTLRVPTWWAFTASYWFPISLALQLYAGNRVFRSFTRGGGIRDDVMGAVVRVRNSIVALRQSSNSKTSSVGDAGIPVAIVPHGGRGR